MKSKTSQTNSKPHHEPPQIGTPLPYEFYGHRLWAIVDAEGRPAVAVSGPICRRASSLLERSAGEIFATELEAQWQIMVRTTFSAREGVLSEPHRDVVLRFLGSPRDKKGRPKGARKA
jgi:hypothetical protein